GHLAGRAAGSGARVEVASDLGPDTAQVERDRLAAHLDADADRDVPAERHTIVVHERLGLVHAVRNCAHGSARHALTLLEDESDAVGERLGAVALEEAGDAALPSADRGNLGPEVAHGAVGEPAVGAEDRGELGILMAGFKNLHAG